MVDFLAAARVIGLKIGLGSGSASDTLRYILDYLDLRRFFDVLVGAGDVDSGKPHPKTYAMVAEKLDAALTNCLVFEDAVLGEHAAYKAGMHCVAVTTTLAAAHFQAPLLAIKDFTEVTSERLRELFGPVGETSVVLGSGTRVGRLGSGSFFVLDALVLSFLYASRFGVRKHGVWVKIGQVAY